MRLHELEQCIAVKDVVRAIKRAVGNAYWCSRWAVNEDSKHGYCKSKAPVTTRGELVLNCIEADLFDQLLI